MGGVPCAKVIINGRVRAKLAYLAELTRTTDTLLALNSFNEPDSLKSIVEYETQLEKELDEHISKVSSFNTVLAEEI